MFLKLANDGKKTPIITTIDGEFRTPSTNELILLISQFALSAYPVMPSEGLLEEKSLDLRQDVSRYASLRLDIDVSLLKSFLTQQVAKKTFDLHARAEMVVITTFLDGVVGEKPACWEEIQELTEPYKWHNFSSTGDIPFDALIDHQDEFLWKLISSLYQFKTNRLMSIQELNSILKL